MTRWYDQIEHLMRRFKFVALAALLAIVLPGCAIRIPIPDGAAPPSAEPGQPFASFASGATKPSCDCQDAAPGALISAAHLPIYLVLPHPLFGG